VFVSHERGAPVRTRRHKAVPSVRDSESESECVCVCVCVWVRERETLPLSPTHTHKHSLSLSLTGHRGGAGASMKGFCIHPGANLKSPSHRCHPILVAFVWELTEETIDSPLGCLQGGSEPHEVALHLTPTTRTTPQLNPLPP